MALTVKVQLAEPSLCAPLLHLPAEGDRMVGLEDSPQCRRDLRWISKFAHPSSLSFPLLSGVSLHFMLREQLVLDILKCVF